MNSSELHGMSDDVLALTLSDTEKSIFNLRFLASTDKKNTSSEVKKSKKDIARVKSEQRRRELVKCRPAGRRVERRHRHRVGQSRGACPRQASGLADLPAADRDPNRAGH